MTQRKIMRVADVMEQDYVVIDGVATVAEALVLLKERKAHFLIVAKRSEDDEEFWGSYHQLACREVDRIRGLVRVQND